MSLDDASPWETAILKFCGPSLLADIRAPLFDAMTEAVRPYGEAARRRRPGSPVSEHSRRWLYDRLATTWDDNVLDHDGRPMGVAATQAFRLAMARCIEGAFERASWWDLPQDLRVALERAVLLSPEGPSLPLDEGELSPLLQYIAVWLRTGGTAPAWLAPCDSNTPTGAEFVEFILDIVAFHRYELEKDPEAPFEGSVRKAISDATRLLVFVQGPRSEELDIEIYAAKVWFEKWTWLKKARLRGR